MIVLANKNGRKGTLRDKAKEKESDRLRKKRCMQGESSGDSHDTSFTF